MSFCTGRDKNTVLKIARALGLKTPHVIEGGAKIIDFKGGELWSQYINDKSVTKILNNLKNVNNPFSIIADGLEIIDKIPLENLTKITAILIYNLDKFQEEEWIKILATHKDLALSINSDRGSLSTLYITDSLGTKAHGVNKLMEILGVSKGEVIGVGDGKNDIPLLMSSGLKVAMGNAVEEMKKIADYIAPDVDHDGVADVIAEFILK